MLKRAIELKIGDVFVYDCGLCTVEMAYLGDNGSPYNCLNLSSLQPVTLVLSYDNVQMVGKLKVERDK